MKMTVELFDSIINTSQDCVFWKDKERRFLGVNQAFLDYYEFDSADILIGKTDEDMGWHNDPEPFRQDELMVLSGRSTYKAQGKCIIRGEERDIVASKRPLYEGDEIVGLVGSFIDITDVLSRQSGMGGSKAVYTMEKLRKFTFFDKIVDEIGLDELLDPLTGVLTRAYAVKFVQSLIAEHKPFTFVMIDLDNFKYINDSFGHSGGDRVLATVAKGLAASVDGFGLVGRFGGDEFLLVDIKDTEEHKKRAFFEKLYTDSNVLRTNITFDTSMSFITGTSGCASFPADAGNYSELFELIDKMLYLGKRRGRNCYTIYNEEKHRDIEITKIAKNGIFTDMQHLRTELEKEKTFDHKLQKVMPQLCAILKIQDLYYVREDGRMKAVLDRTFDAPAEDIADFMKNDLLSENAFDIIEKESPVFYGTLKEYGFEAVLAARIRKKDQISGYLVCAVKRKHRIWQEDECGILYYLAGLLAD